MAKVWSPAPRNTVDRRLAPRNVGREQPVQVVDGPDARPGEFQHDVALGDAGQRGRAAGWDLQHLHRADIRAAQPARQALHPA